MQVEYNPIILPFLTSGIITAILAAYALSRRVAAARTFALLMLTLTIWTLGYVMELSSVTLEGKIFWLKMKYLGSAPGPAVWFIFSLQSTNQERRMQPLRLAVMAWAALTWLVVFTNDGHRWMWTDIALSPDSPETRTEHGPYFSVYAVGIYLLIFTSVIFYFKYYRATPPFFRRQALLFVLGGFLPLAGRMTEDALGIDLIPRVDEVIFFFLFSGILFALALFKYGAFNIVHIAHNLVVHNIRAGIIVLDVLGRLVELNPYAREMFGMTDAQAVGKTIREALVDWPEMGAGPGQGKEICVRRGDRQAYFSVQNSVIKEDDGTYAGYVMVLFDITARKEVERQLELLARTDPLTGVANRRHFFELAEAEFLRSRRYEHPLTIMLLDVDHFKKINDAYGHLVGDQVLKFIAAAGPRNLRATDVFARYGGEEFICLLTEISPEDAASAAERIRRMIEESELDIEQERVRVTISVGLAHLNGDEPVTLDGLIDRADQALYRSKSDGRNRVTTWG